jgi:L-ribulose-5-phosphate 3-epimerase
MILGYNTNGFAHHRLHDCIELIAELGYGGVAVTPDVHHLDPQAHDFDQSLDSLAIQLDRLKMRACVETGARFLLDTRRKHQPTLISRKVADRKRRFAFLAGCIRTARRLNATCLSFWSGSADGDESHGKVMNRLASECRKLADLAARNRVRLAFEPEPGMLIDTMTKYSELAQKVDHPSFGLTIDVGHLVCMGERPIGQIAREWNTRLWNVHLDDMRHGVHDHLRFGEGEVDFKDWFKALREINFQGIASVELSRHSHDAVNTARESLAFLRRIKK